jgi:hypothetical protein
MGEGSVGLYRQVSVVKGLQPLINVNYKCDKSKSRIVHVRLVYEFVCDFVGYFNAVFSIDTLVLVMFYFVTFVFDTYFGILCIMSVNKGHSGSVMWLMLILSGTVFGAVLFIVLTQSCSGTTCEVRLCINLLFLIAAVFSKREERNV